MGEELPAAARAVAGRAEPRRRRRAGANATQPGARPSPAPPPRTPPPPAPALTPLRASVFRLPPGGSGLSPSIFARAGAHRQPPLPLLVVWWFPVPAYWGQFLLLCGVKNLQPELSLHELFSFPSAPTPETLLDLDLFLPRSFSFISDRWVRFQRICERRNNLLLC